MLELKTAVPDPFFVAEKPRKFSINRVFDFFKKKEDLAKSKVRWLAFSKKIADALTSEQEKAITEMVDGDKIEKTNLKKDEIQSFINVNKLFGMIIFPAVPAVTFLHLLATGNDEFFNWAVGAAAAVLAFLNLLNTIKTNEYFVALKQKMIEEDMDEVVAFVETIQFHGGGLNF